MLDVIAINITAVTNKSILAILILPPSVVNIILTIIYESLYELQQLYVRFTYVCFSTWVDYYLLYDKELRIANNGRIGGCKLAGIGFGSDGSDFFHKSGLRLIYGYGRLL
jgi:hypothetical protein